MRQRDARQLAGGGDRVLLRASRRGGCARRPLVGPPGRGTTPLTRPGRQALGIGLIGRSVLATRETGCYALHVCSGGTFYSRRGLTASSAAGAAPSRAPPTLPAHERGWVTLPGSLSGFTKRRLNGARSPSRDLRATAPEGSFDVQHPRDQRLRAGDPGGADRARDDF